MIPISIKNVSMFYPNGTKALNNVSFDVMPGEDLVLLGHNGSGKSTMFKCITGFERPTSGEIWIDDHNIVSNRNRNKMKQMRKQVGMVFQHFHLVNNLSVFQNVLFGSLGQEGTLRSLSPFAPKELRFKAMECLERVGLSHLAKRRADELSGGQKQRVAIARVLLQDPKVILADEPIASLDPKAGREVMNLLWEVSRERGISIICVLHQLELALEYGNRIIGLKAGEVYMDSRSEQLSVNGLHFLYEDGQREPERLILHG